MEIPIITVYITNYNYAKFIRRSIESVLHQTIQNFELFIIDDGSTDGSKRIIEEYSNNSKIKIIYQNNKGLNITNNIALRAAKGKYIMRLDADDYLEQSALEVMMSTLEKSNNTLGLVFPDYYLIDENDEKIGQVQRMDFRKEVKLLDQPAHGACTMIRRDYLLSLGGYNESYTCQDGYELWIKFITHYPVANINIPLFSYRQHGNNLTSNEDRILETRSKIKDNYVDLKKLDIPKTVVVIPIREAFINGTNLALMKLGGITLLEKLINTLKLAKRIDSIVISSESKEIEQFFSDNYLNVSSVYFVKRPSKFARINESLSDTLNLVLKDPEIEKKDFEALMTVSINYPNISSEEIDDAINSMVIFDSDSLLSVRPDNSVYYQHDGTGLKAILEQDKFTKLEREALYKGVGGIVISKISGFLKTSKMLNGKIGHIVISKTSSYSIEDKRDLSILNYLNC